MSEGARLMQGEGPQVIAVNPEYIGLVGGAAAILLSQIVYWSSNNRLRVKRDGVLWLAKKREDLAAECGLTLNQYRWCMSKLKKLGLVVVEQHKFAGDPISHIRLDRGRLDALCGKSVATRVASPLPPVRQVGCHTYTETTGRDYDREQQERLTPQELVLRVVDPKTVRAQENRNELCRVRSKHLERKTFERSVVDSSSPNAVGREQQDVGQRKPKLKTELVYVNHTRTDHPRVILDWVADRPELAERRLKTTFTGEEWMAKASEILRNHRHQFDDRAVRLTAMSLAMAWKRLYSRKYEEYVKDLTKKEIGQLRMYLQKVGEQAPTVMEYVLDHWEKFAFEAKSRKGLPVVPERPVVGFLLQHYDVALQLIAKPKAKPKFDKPKELPQTPQQVVEEKATYDDVLQALQGLGKSV